MPPLKQLLTAAFWSHGERPWYPALGVSTLLHVGAIIALGLLWTQLDRGVSHQVESRWAPDSTVEQQLELTTLALPTTEQSPDPGGRSSTTASLQPAEEPAVAPPSFSELILDDPEIDLVLRYCHPDSAPPGAERLFGELITPTVSCALAQQAERGHAPPLAKPADLAQHALLEEDDHRPSADFLTWRAWLRQFGVPRLEPARWLYLNFTYQQVQAALAGGGVALGRLPLIIDNLSRGELIEPLGPAHRLPSPFTYWLVDLASERGARPEVSAFAQWLREQAALTRQQIDAAVNAPRPRTIGSQDNPNCATRNPGRAA